MQKALLIAEKPSLMKTIEAVYNKHKSSVPYDITFTSQAGHLYRLLYPAEMDEEQKQWGWDKIPFFPDEHGGFKYTPIVEKAGGAKYKLPQQYLKEIKDELKSGVYDAVINAGDPDQEGELLIRETLEELHNKLPVLRFWSNDLTEMKVLDALQNLLDDDNDPMLINLLSAAKARQHSDYIVGMNVTEAATLKLGGRTAVGRVKTPIQAIVCKRELEIKNFKQKTVYGVKAVYTEGFEGQYYNAPVTAEEGDDEKEDTGLVYFDTKDEADEFINSLSGPATVTKFETKRVKTYAPKLFKLATAQIAAGKLGYDSAKTLAIIQSLYEAKVLSYPRTDCEYLSSSEDYGAMLKSAAADPELAPFVAKIPSSVISSFSSNKRYVSDAKLKDSGHSALVPTTNAPDFGSLSKEQKDIFHIVARQFVAAFLPPLEQDKTLLLADVNGNCFKSTGKTLVSKGYTELTGSNFTDMEIPKHVNGDSLDIDKFDIAEKTSRCPKRFKDADLIAVCENPAKYLEDESLNKLGKKKLSIGTPATRSGIIQTLITRDKYLGKMKGDYIIPTETGMGIYENLRTFDICKVDMTALWEEKLELIRSGKETREEMESGMKDFVRNMMNAIKDSDISTVSFAGKSKEPLGKCPLCGGDMLSGKNGFFCSNWKEKGCQFGSYKKIGATEVTDNEYKKLLVGEHVKKKVKTKQGKTFESVLALDMATGKIIFVEQEKKVIAECPKCGGHIISGDKGFYCSNWKEKGCTYGTPRIIKMTKITDDEYLKMLNGQEETIRIRKSKTDYWDQKMRVDPDTGKLVFVKEERIDVPTEHECPKCHKTKLIRSGRVIKCPDESGCGFLMWTQSGGHEFTEDEINTLLSGGTTLNIAGFKSKAGKTFSAKVKLDDDMSGKTEYIFEERKFKKK